MQIHTAYIGLGSNLGHRDEFIGKAIELISQLPGVRSVTCSSIVETKPLGGVAQPAYLNAVAQVRTDLEPLALLRELQRIENLLGRVRTAGDTSRTIDLDIILFDDRIIETAELIIPHPRMHLRSFVLRALLELDANIVHPGLGTSIEELAARLNNTDFVLESGRAQVVAIAGVIGVGKTTLARGLAKELGGTLLLEAYDTNPFLAKVYAGQKELALDSQLYFLTTRVEQLSKNSLKAGELVICDYVFDKEHIYAKRLLDRQQCDLYCKINGLISDKVSQPVVLIYLKDTVQECMDRIHHRNRPYEQRIQKEFLDLLDHDYEELLANWNKCPVITINTQNFDCRDMQQVRKLAAQINAYVAVNK